MIAIKDTPTLTSVLVGFDHMLVDIVVWITETYSRTVLTCGFRSGDKGVHGTWPCRGLDIRSWVFTDPKKVVNHVNSKWTYDPKRPDMRCAILHGGKKEHIHLQTHPNTVKIL